MSWPLGLSLLGLDALAIQIEVGWLRDQALTFLKTCEHFHYRTGGLSQGDVAEVCYPVLVEYVNSLQLTAVYDGSLRNEQCRPITTGELCSAEQPRPQPRNRR